MTALDCGHYTWEGGTATDSYPVAPDPAPGFTPPDPGPLGVRWQVAVCDFPSGNFRGILTDAEITHLSDRAEVAGGNQLEFTVPWSDQAVRLLGDNQPGTSGKYHAKYALAREYLVGSTDGTLRYRFIGRDPWEIADGKITVGAKGIIGGLTGDRIIGAPERPNLIGETRGTFATGDLTGWEAVGDVVATVVAGGPAGAYQVQLTGTPNRLNYLQAMARISHPDPGPWGQTQIAGSAYISLPPDGIDIDGSELISVAVFDVGSGAQRWPDPNTPPYLSDDPDAAVVSSGMTRGGYSDTLETGFGYLPAPPFFVDAYLRLYPTSTTVATTYTGGTLSGRENRSTVYPVDITQGIGLLFNMAQTDRDKSDWGVSVAYGTPAGITDTLTYWYDDGKSMAEEITAITGRGCEVWDDNSVAHRQVKVAQRRGQVRADVTVNQCDILGKVTWRVDPGAQRSALRAQSAASSVWSGADRGAIDTSHSLGQVIDVAVAGPAGLNPVQLRAWAVEKLAPLRSPQMTTTILVRWDLGARFTQGDTFELIQQAGPAVDHDWVRILAWTPDLDHNLVALDVATDPELGGTP